MHFMQSLRSFIKSVDVPINIADEQMFAEQKNYVDGVWSTPCDEKIGGEHCVSLLQVHGQEV